VDSGNGFGTHVFWTTVIPDGDVQVNLLTGTAQMRVRNLPELDYYSPEGTGDLASLGPTWQTGYFDSAVSIDVVWNRPVTRVVKVQDAANGFAGTFEENQATVTWSVASTSGFSFTSNPGNFSTSVPEVPGVNGVTAPLNFFAQVAFERNGIFFPQGEKQGAGLAPSLDAMAPLAIGLGSVSTAGSVGMVPQQIQPALVPTQGTGPKGDVPAGSMLIQRSSESNSPTLWVARSPVLDSWLADLDGFTLWSAFHNAADSDWRR
jgi:hypothetical protein